MKQQLLTYQVKIGTAPWTVYYGFDRKTKQLKAFEIEYEGIIEAGHYNWLLRHMPGNEEMLVQHTAKLFEGKKSRITFMPEVITFEMFWKKYANTLGNKKRAQKMWDLLPQSEQVAAYAFIDTYNSYLRQNPTLTKKYPDTYLNQETWKN
jgi:hypothetical protein